MVWIANVIFGRRLPALHDYVVLRPRYAHHGGAYGWARKWRLGRVVFVVEKNRNLFRGVRAKFRMVGIYDEGWR